ncbi:response regulator [Trichlorobacter lovleyi]|uniref:response regulator n=1 Tax=Trichlorobacter lovleyi TaxID=313985 RepID=UPI0023F2C7F4|nr:response regulator [Trichlorobacter lovleyi]
MRILIAEDDFYSRKLMMAYLSPFGECDVAVNGVEAWEAFLDAHDAGTPYSLICLDIMMPEMDGQEALKKMRDEEDRRQIERHKKAKIIMITALDEMKAIMASYHSLCDGYLMKPINHAMVVEQLKECGVI